MPAPPLDVGEPPPPPRSGEPGDLGFTPAQRVRWFAPTVLGRTAIQVTIAQKFSELLDRRDLQSTLECEHIDLSAEGDPDFWFDYTADTGDGFDATATVASVLAREEITFGETTTKAGSLLVLGGDEVYPAATEQAYDDRLIGPFRAMLPWTENPRRLVALPGNHDWYDSLTSFLRVFCRRPDGRWLGGWKTVQSRSYWAVRLPHGWWLWGVDISLGTYIDPPQVEYFLRMRKLLSDTDRVILCWAKPTWTDPVPDGRAEVAKGLDFFMDKVIGDPSIVRLCLAGDKHHYARYEPDAPEVAQKLTVGGGGAYLSATHRLKDPLDLPSAAGPEVPHRLRRTYPDADASRRLCRGVFGALYANPRYPFVPALLYALFALPGAWLHRQTRGDLTWLDAVAPVIACVAAVVVLLLGLNALARISGRPSTRHAWFATFLHALLHAVPFLAAFALSRWLDWRLSDDLTGAALLCFAAGLLAGPLATGTYLFLAQRMDVNVNEAFSAMAIQDYKCFLRVHVLPGGDLELFPVKVERVPTWTFGPDGKRWFRPSAEPVAELIEPPVRVARG